MQIGSFDHPIHIGSFEHLHTHIVIFPLSFRSISTHFGSSHLYRKIRSSNELVLKETRTYSTYIRIIHNLVQRVVIYSHQSVSAWCKVRSDIFTTVTSPTVSMLTTLTKKGFMSWVYKNATSSIAYDLTTNDGNKTLHNKLIYIYIYILCWRMGFLLKSSKLINLWPKDIYMYIHTKHLFLLDLWQRTLLNLPSSIP